MDFVNKEAIVQQVVQAKASEQPNVQTIKATEPEVEALTTAPVQEAPKDDFSSKFAELTRREREALTRQRQVKLVAEKLRQEREAWNKDQAEFSELRKLREDARKNPKSWLEKAGLTTEDIVKTELNDGKPAPEIAIRSLQEEITKLKTEVEEARKIKEQADVQSQIGKIKDDIAKQVRENEVEYEIINADQAYDTVLDVMAKYHADTGEFLDYKTACSEVEKALYEKRIELLDSTKKLKKFASYFNGASDPMAELEKATAPSDKVTLTNKQQTSISPVKDDLPIEIEKRLAALSKKYGFNQQQAVF